jgi:hypothetical protein
MLLLYLSPSPGPSSARTGACQ